MPTQDIIVLNPQDVMASVGATPAIAELWAIPLSGSAILHNIKNPYNLAMWLATIGHESRGLAALIESMNFSAKRLTEVWPERFAIGTHNPNDYAHQPEKLANFVYADKNRSPNHRLGNTEPGDGWRFIGRGAISLTGRENYTRCSAAICVDLVRFPDLLQEPPVSARAAAWFWQDKGINTITDFEAATRKVNGDLIGWADRQARLHRIIKLFKERGWL